MSRYIDADKVKTHFDANTWQGEFMIAMCDVTETEDVAPVVHSSWRTLCGYSKCNNCGQRSVKQSNYCSNCGAKMDKE